LYVNRVNKAIHDTCHIDETLYTPESLPKYCSLQNLTSMPVPVKIMFLASGSTP